jgi:uncharacterized protein YdeI (YjbR/CyaY-like superfamily)
MAKSVAKSFQAVLERGKWRLNWVVIRVPFDVLRVWGKRGQLKVRGDINGFAFRTSLFPTGDGEHVLLVNKRMQAAAKVSVGSQARFCLEPDTEVRTVELPGELVQAFAGDRALRRWLDQLNYSSRKYICEWITEVKGVKARLRRADQIAERLLSVMEAERELPPILRVAFARNPLAAEGWRRMSVSHRRAHLFGIFYYRNPEARARRVSKMLEDACKFAKRPARREP